MTTKGQPYPVRVACRFGGRTGLVVLDQVRTLDTTRLIKRIGRLSPTTMSAVLARLQEMFAP
jgi:mRNA interferase MazF